MSRSAGAAIPADENPTYEIAECLITDLEGGAASCLFGSGMAAIATLVQAMRPGDHIVAGKSMYFGTPKLLKEWAVPWGLAVDLVDTTDTAAIAAALRPGQTKLVLVETPANPLWAITDLAAAAELAHGAGALLAVDNTAATPVLTRPIELGADIVVHSATKYLNGHSDVLAGALVTARADDPYWERVVQLRYLAGPVLGPVRGLAAAARHAHPVRAGGAAMRECSVDRPPLHRPWRGGRGLLSRPAELSRP